MDISKKYLQVKKGDNPALGNFVNYYLYTNKVKKIDVSNGLNIAYHTFNRYLKQNSFQFTILWRMSQIVNYNFLMDLGEWLEIPYETKAEKELQQQLTAKDEELKTLKIQLEIFKQIHKIEG